MLESIAASLLTKYLGDYVEGLDTSNLKLNLSAGDAVLTNLKLKKSALESLELPITIKNGFLGKLTLQIPWSSLGSKAAIIRIDGIYLVAGPKTRTKATAEEEKLRKQQVKQQRLQLADLLGLDKPEQASSKPDEKDKKKDDGFFSRLAMKVVDNVQIFLDNIHIRYEDDVSNKDHPFAFGITLDSLHAQSCNGQWEAAFLTVGADVIHKLVNLNNLSIYWNTTKNGNATFVDCDNAQTMSATLKQLIPSNPDNTTADGPVQIPDHHYLLRPVSGVLKATIDRGDLVLSRPRLQLDAELHRIGIALNSSQFQRAQDLLEHFSLYVRSLEYMDLRPPVDVRPTDNPKLWWKFVLSSVRESVVKKYKCWTWEAIQARSRDRSQYMDLYEKKLTVTLEKMTPDDKKALEALETKLEYTDIITFRQLAYASFQRKELAKKEKKKQQGWFGGWFGGGSSAGAQKDETQKKAEEDAAMKELYSAIGYNADQVEKETVFPKDYIKTKVNFKIADNCLELRQDDLIDAQRAAGVKDKALNPVILSFDQRAFVVSLLMREGSMSVVSSLETIKMSDFHTLSGKELVMMEPDATIADQSSRSDFMRANFDMNPLDAPGIDIRVGLKLQPVQTVLSRALIDRVVQFFERQSTRPQLVEISSAASSTWDDLRNRAQTSLKYAVEKRTKLKLDVELSAPRFTIPQNFTDPTCPAIVVDLGTISFKSDPEARGKAVTGPTANADISEDFFYDRYDLSMKNLHAMVVGGLEAPWAKSKAIDPAKYVVINKFDLDVILKTCSADSPELPQLKLSGALNRLALDLTDYRITWALDVLESVGKSTLPPKVLTEAEKAAMKLLLAEMKREEQRKAKLAAERAAIAESLNRTQVPDPHGPVATMVHRRKPRPVASIGDAPGTPVQSKADKAPEVKAEPDPISGSTPALQATKIDPTLLRKQLEVDFKLGDLSVTLHKTAPVSQQPGSAVVAPPSTPLTTLALKELTVKFSQSNHWMTVGLRLGAFIVEDKLSPGAPNLIESGSYITGLTDHVDDLVELKYRNTPRSSVAFDRVEHEVTATFGTLKINLNRVTIACLMQVGNDFARSMKKPEPEAKPDSKPEESEDTQGSNVPDEEAPSKPPPRTDVSLAKLDLQLGALIVCMQKENVSFLQFDVARSRVGIDIRDDSVMHISGFLGGISLEHPDPTSKLTWPKLVSISGDKILHFQFSKYNRESPTYPGYDLSLMAQMSSLQVTVVYASIQELIVYFGAFEKMRNAIQLTTAYYYNAGVDAVRQAADAATKLKLQVEVQNPTIIVPQSSTDSRHILLDLGKIFLRNSWQTLPTGVELETIEASVTGLNLRALPDPNATDFVKNLRIINDSNLVALVKRPLSGNADHSSPNLECNADLNAIDISFTEDYLALVFGILSDNLGEKPARPDIIELDQTVAFLKNFSYTMEGWEAQEGANSATASTVPEVLAKPFVNMSVHAALKQVSLTVFKGSGQNPTTLKPTSLGTFAIQDLFADYKQFSDSVMDVDVKLGAVILEDKRINSLNKFRRIWAPSVGGGAVGNRDSSINLLAAAKPQFALTYKAEPAENFTSIKMELYRPRLYLIPDTIQELYEYAMDNVERMTKSLAQLKASQEANAKSSNSEAPAPSDAASSSDLSVGPTDKSLTDAKDAPVTTMGIEILLTSPELCVVENTEKSDPVALILHLGESKLRFFMTSDGQQKLDLGVQKLDAYKCILDADHSDIAHDIVKLLQPLTLGFNMGNGEDKIRRMAVEVGELAAIVSYNDIKLFMDVYASYQPLLDTFSKPRGDAKKETEAAISEMETNVALMTLDAPKDLELTKPVAEKGKSAEKSEKSKKAKEQEEEQDIIVINRNAQTQQMIVTINSVRLSLLNDRESPDYTIPVAEQTLEYVKVMFSMYESGSMEALVTLSTLELKAYNNRLAAFEPVIEPWGVEVNFLKSPTALGLHVVSQEMMDINITKSLLDTTFGMLKLLDDFKTPENSEGDSSSQTSSSIYSTKSKRNAAKLKKKRVSFHPYVVRNETTYPVAIRLSNNPSKISNIAAGNEYAISLHVDREEAAKRVVRPEMDITFPDQSSLQGISRVPISRIATYCYPISDIDPSICLAIDISFEQGSKTVTLRSNRVINNETNTDIEIGIIGPTAKDWSTETFTLPANDHISIPIELCNYRSLRFKPKGSTLKWHEWTRGDDQLRQSREQLKRQQRGHTKTDASRSTLFLCIDELKDSVWVCRSKEVEKSAEGNDRMHDFIMTLSPALVIENSTCADVSVSVVNQDAGESYAIAPSELLRATEVECYNFEGWTQLSQGLSGMSLALKLPGFTWSAPIRFAEHARWVPCKGNAKKLSEPLKLVLGDETHARPLEMLADIKVNDHGTCHIVIYSEYWLINQTGLNLFYKSGESSKAVESAGQRTPAPNVVPNQPILHGDPATWYDTLDSMESTDYLYSHNRFFFGAHKLSIKVEDSPWSEPFPLGIQNEGMITIKDKDHSERRYDFGVRVKPAPGRFWRTKLVRLYPGFILVNKTSMSLRYRQEGGHGPNFELKANQQLPFHWTAQDAEKLRLMICSEQNPDSWSPAFSLDIAGGFQVRLRNEFSESDEEKTLDVIVKPLEGTTFVIFGDQSTGSPVTVVSYELQNRSSAELSIKQKDSPFAFNLSPNATQPFCWDVPQVLEPLLQLRLARDPSKYASAELSLDVIAKYPDLPPYRAADGTQLSLEVQAQGPKKVLIVTDFVQNTKPDPISAATSAPSDLKASTSDTPLDDSIPDRVVATNFKVSLKGIGVSVIDTTPQELLYFTLQTLFADVQLSNIDQSVEVKIGLIQLDNQLYLSPMPIALYSTPNPEKPFFHATLVRDPNVTAVQFFKYFALQLQEIELSIHEVFLYRLLSFTKFVTDYLYAKSEEEALQKLLLQTDSEIPKLKDEDLSDSDMYYFELFHLNPVKVLVSFMTSIDLDASANEQKSEDDEEGDNSSGGLAEILGYVGILTDIERAPIELNALMLTNPFCNKNDLMQRITKHYTLAGLKQAYKIVGSADFLGNPVSLVSNLGTGVKDFFYEPAMGIVESPAAFGKGLAKGTKSLVLKTTYAIFDTASKLTGTVAKVGAKLTMDDDYQRERAIRNQTKARHAGEGIVYGARDFGIGLYKGITGVVLEPIKGGQQEGALGVVKGIGKGLAGIVLKPVVGAVDLVTRTTEGIKNTTTYMDEKSKAPIRPPRYFGADGLVHVFDYERAAGQLVLRTLSERRGRRDIYESHVILKDTLVLFSRRHIFKLEQDKLHFGFKWQIDWKEKLSNISAAIVTIPTETTSSDQKPFTGVVFMIDPLQGESRSRRIRSDAKQAGAIGKRLNALNVQVKRATSLAQISKPSSISNVPINASTSDVSIPTRSPPQTASSSKVSTEIQKKPKPASSSASEPENQDLFTIKVNPKAGQYSALPDWRPEEDDEDDLYGSITRKRRRKAKASETTRLLGESEAEEGGCCSCSCSVM